MPSLDPRRPEVGPGLTALLAAALVPAAGACRETSTRLPTDPFADLPVWTVGAEPDLRIGRLDGPDEYTFAGVRAAAPSGDTLLVVADGGANEIRLYGMDGSFVRAMGGPGSGPGEFQRIGPIEVGQGLVSAWDYHHHRVTTFRLDGELVRTVEWRAPAGEGTPVVAGFRHDGSGFARLMGGGGHETLMNRQEGPFREPAAYAWFDPDGTGEVVYRDAGDERLVTRDDHGYQISAPPLGRRSLAALVGETLVVGITDSLKLVRVDSDGSVRPFVHQDVAPRPFSDDDWASYRDRAERARERRRELGMPAGEEIDRPLHETYPVFTQIRAGSDGHVWVAESAGHSGTSWPWWIFDGEGEPVGRFVSRPIQLESLDTARVIGVERDELGVESVVVYRVQRTGEGGSR